MHMSLTETSFGNTADDNCAVEAANPHEHRQEAAVAYIKGSGRGSHPGLGPLWQRNLCAAGLGLCLPEAARRRKTALTSDDAEKDLRLFYAKLAYYLLCFFTSGAVL